MPINTPAIDYPDLQPHSYHRLPGRKGPLEECEERSASGPRGLPMGGAGRRQVLLGDVPPAVNGAV